MVNYETLVLVALVFLVAFGIIRMLTGKKGSWSQALPVESKMLPDTGSESKGEERTKKFLEAYFSRPFKKVRPFFMENAVTGHNLELDCYNEELKLAVEYNGRQHYEYVPYFHKNKEAFYNQKYRDELKRIYCKKFGICLIEIPYTETWQLEQYLYKQLTDIYK
jgi:hypothetical protein